MFLRFFYAYFTICLRLFKLFPRNLTLDRFFYAFFPQFASDRFSLLSFYAFFQQFDPGPFLFTLFSRNLIPDHVSRTAIFFHAFFPQSDPWPLSQEAFLLFFHNLASEFVWSMFSMYFFHNLTSDCFHKRYFYTFCSVFSEIWSWTMYFSSARSFLNDFFLFFYSKLTFWPSLLRLFPLFLTLDRFQKQVFLHFVLGFFCLWPLFHIILRIFNAFCSRFVYVFQGFFDMCLRFFPQFCPWPLFMERCFLRF